MQLLVWKQKQVQKETNRSYEKFWMEILVSYYNINCY